MLLFSIRDKTYIVLRDKEISNFFSLILFFFKRLIIRNGIQRRKFRSLFPSLNRDGIISVSNLGRKLFRLYLETEIETEISVSD